MNVAVFNTDDDRGGAARAALRLHDAFRSAGVDSRFLARRKQSQRSDVIACGVTDPASPYNQLQTDWINPFRTSLTNTFFSVGYPGASRLEECPLDTADIFHLHWVTNFLGPRQIRYLLSLGKPVVWTLHDQWPFTGGCHYTAGCENFLSLCQRCPQLSEDSLGLVEAGFRDKVAAYAGQITFVGPSKWIAESARRSRIGQSAHVEVIPNCLDVNAFAPGDKLAARQKLGIPAEAFVCLFACSWAGEARKGAAAFREIRLRLLADPRLKQRNEAGRLWFLFFGGQTEKHSIKGSSEKHLGFLMEDSALREAYQAADLLVHVSSEDNLPNTLVESMSCGTPAIAFDAGGAAEVISHGQTGLVAPLGDFSAVAAGIIELIESPERRSAFGLAARQTVLDRYHPTVVARQHLELFAKLRSRAGERTPPIAGEEPDRVGAKLSEAVAKTHERKKLRFKIRRLLKKFGL